MNKQYAELFALQDYELIAVIRDKIIDEISNTSEEDLEQIAEIKFYLITASMFDLEMQNGGFCQFLLNEGRMHGPFLDAALRAFGAEKIERLLVDFCENNGIDLCELQKVLPESVDPYSMTEDYLRLLNQYPFDDFDRAYFECDQNNSLEVILGTYIRSNIAQFV